MREPKVYRGASGQPIPSPQSSRLADPRDRRGARAPNCRSGMPIQLAYLREFVRESWQCISGHHECGNTLIKALLPAPTDKTYAGMEIADGTTSSQEFPRIIFGTATVAEKRGSGWRWRGTAR